MMGFWARLVLRYRYHLPWSLQALANTLLFSFGKRGIQHRGVKSLVLGHRAGVSAKADGLRFPRIMM